MSRKKTDKKWIIFQKLGKRAKKKLLEYKG